MLINLKKARPSSVAFLPVNDHCAYCYKETSQLLCFGFSSLLADSRYLNSYINSVVLLVRGFCTVINMLCNGSLGPQQSMNSRIYNRRVVCYL